MQVNRLFLPEGHPLRPYVLSIWRLRSRAGFASETILPKGNVDLLFNLGGPIERRGGGGEMVLIRSATSFLAGVQTTAFTTRPLGEVYLFGVSLRMESVSDLLPLPSREVVDRMVESGWVYPCTDGLCERLAESPEFRDQCRILLRWLAAWVRPRDRAPSVRYACSWLRRSPEAPRVAAFARQNGVSERHLRRVFHEHVGVSPAQYVRLSRFVLALEAMSSLPTLTEVAHAAHYYDQAHFCRDFREIARMSPTDYRARAGEVQGHIYVP